MHDNHSFPFSFSTEKTEMKLLKKKLKTFICKIKLSHTKLIIEGVFRKRSLKGN